MECVCKIVTVSDAVSHGAAEDRSGDALETCLKDAGFTVAARAVVKDGVEPVAALLRELASGFAGCIITTGGTGFSPRDLTPEATLEVIEREAPGLAEAMRAVSPLGRLSRAIAGCLDRCLIINTPGSPSGAVECVSAVIDIIPHALELLSGGNPHPHGSHHYADPS